MGLLLIVFPLAGLANGTILGAILRMRGGGVFLMGALRFAILGVVFRGALDLLLEMGLEGGGLRAAVREGLALGAGLAFFFGAAFLLDLATGTPTPFDIHRLRIGRLEMPVIVHAKRSGFIQT
jgi:hypothetical protein